MKNRPGHDWTGRFLLKHMKKEIAKLFFTGLAATYSPVP